MLSQTQVNQAAVICDRMQQIMRRLERDFAEMKAASDAFSASLEQPKYEHVAVHHLDGNPRNNNPANLMFVPASTNR
jgi:hypothetical protein